jgi:hypothetical protein
MSVVRAARSIRAWDAEDRDRLAHESVYEHEVRDMALEDYFESEVAVAVAATAAVLSPGVRRMLRRGAVYGVAGALKATDVVTAAARGVAQGVSSPTAAADAGDGRADVPKQPTKTKRA